MLHVEKAINLIFKRNLLSCGLLFAAVLAMLPIPAGAQCKSREAGLEMLIVQPGFQSSLTIEQNGSVITGKAWGSVREDDGTKTITAAGKVDGTFDGNNFSIQIYWYNDHTGVYNGKVLPSGRLDGEGYEKRSPNVRVPWHSEGVLKCSPVIPKPIKSSGKAKVVSQPPPQPKPPYVATARAIFPTPYNPIGFVILTWDAGPDHPDAELWLKTPGGAGTISKLAKGGFQLPVERGRSYEYVLTKAGKILAGVTFVAQ